MNNKHAMISTLHIAASIAFVATATPICAYLSNYLTGSQYVFAIQFATLIDAALLYIYKQSAESTTIHIPASPISELEQQQRDTLWRLITHVQSSDHIDGNVPIHNDYAYDAISGETLDRTAYILDDSIYSPLNAATLQQLFHPRTGRGPLKNPFTNLDVRRVRKVRVLTQTNKEAEAAYEAAMRASS